MTQKVPPPPRIATVDPELNRWLLEIQSILNADGGIDADQISGLQRAVSDISNQLTSIENTLNLQAQAISFLSLRLQNGVARPPDSYGSDGNWFAVTVGAQRGVYVRVAGVWVLVAN